MRTDSTLAVIFFTRRKRNNPEKLDIYIRVTVNQQRAEIATLLHEDKIRKRVKQLKHWTKELAENLKSLGIRTFPTETYFFLADFAPHNEEKIAEALKEKGFLLKALEDPVLGDGFMRATTSTPENNYRFVKVLKELLSTL